MPEITDELPRLLTEYMRRSEGDGDSPYLRRAKALRHVFVNKTPVVDENDLLPGHTTNTKQGPVCYIDTVGSVIWPELKTVSTRTINPFKIDPEVARRMSRDIFPYWMRRSIQEVARYSDYDTGDYADRDEVEGEAIDPPLKKKAGETPRCQYLYERVAFYIAFIASCVSHTVPDFNRFLKFGLKKLADRMDDDMARFDLEDKQKAFLVGVKQVFEGAVVYAHRLANQSEITNWPASAGRSPSIRRKPFTRLPSASGSCTTSCCRKTPTMAFRSAAWIRSFSRITLPIGGG